MKTYLSSLVVKSIAILILLASYACTKYDTPPPYEDEVKEIDLRMEFDRKVLWINIDGATSDVVQEVVPQNIARILKNSKYYFKGLSAANVLDDGRGEEPANWFTLLTGVNPHRHRIASRAYLPEIVVDVNEQGTTIQYFQNIFQYVSAAMPLEKSICVTPWSALNDEMLTNTYLTLTSTSDEEGKNLAIHHINGESEEDATLLLVAFGDMLNAGKEGGFTAANSQYVAALNRIDGYIGELVETIEQRQTYLEEDWLVVITSNHGGDETGSISSLESKNNFGIYYFPHYEEENFTEGKEYNEEFVWGAFFDRTNTAFAIDTLEIYSTRVGKPISIEIVAQEISYNGRYTGFPGTDWVYIARKNWAGFYRQRNLACTMVAGLQYNYSNGFNDPFWHTFGFAAEQPEPNITNVNTFFDGVIVNVQTADGSRTTTDRSNFVIGTNCPYRSHYVATVRSWDINLNEEQIAESSLMVDISPSHPMYQHLVAYWIFSPENHYTTIDPDTDETVYYVRNQIEGGEPMRFRQQPKFTQFNNTLPMYRRHNPVFENASVMPQILYWLQIPVPTNIDGTVFLNEYAMDEQWRERVDL